MISSLIYLLCALTSLLCTYLLIRSYKRSKSPLIFWTSIFFITSAVSNILLFVDYVIVPSVDFSLVRTVLLLAGISMLVYGLVFENEN
jgi:hypothetical protein